MKYFLSYKFTRVPLDQLHNNIDPIMEVLAKYGQPYCNLYDDDFYASNKYDARQIMEHALQKLDQCDYYIIFVDKETGEGMLIEYGYACKLNIPRLVLMPTNYESVSMKALASNVICYDNLDDLLQKLSAFLSI